MSTCVGDNDLNATVETLVQTRRGNFRGIK